MPQKTVNLPGIGDVIIAKRRGSRSVRLSVSAAGRVRVGLPSWLPYSAGVEFALARRAWITRQLEAHHKQALEDGGRIGKSYRLRYIHDPKVPATAARISGQYISVRSASSIDDSNVQQAARQAAERALRKEAERLLPPRLSQLSERHGFDYHAVRVKKLSSRWGSCSSTKEIALNYFLMQLPWNMIDHVLLHELVHTEHLNHGPDFWRRFESILPGAKQQRSQLKQYRPVINTVA